MALEAVPPKAVILAAGRGERLRPPTDGLPKPMLPARSIVVEEIPEEGGNIVFGRFFALPSGQEKTLQIEYVSPTVVDTEPGCWEYRLFIQKRPGQKPLPTTVRVVPPAGMKIRSVVVDGDVYAADSEIALVLEHDWTLEPEPGAA